MRKVFESILFFVFMVCFFTSCATASGEKQTKAEKSEEPVIKNVNVLGAWMNLYTEDKELLDAISGNRKCEEVGLWFKKKGRAHIIVKINGIYYSTDDPMGILRYKVSGAGITLKFPDGTIIKSLVKISNDKMILTIPDNPPIVMTMTKFKDENMIIISD